MLGWVSERADPPHATKLWVVFPHVIAVVLIAAIGESPLFYDDTALQAMDGARTPRNPLSFEYGHEPPK